MAFTIFLGVALACSPASPSRAAFTEQILKPLADQRADELLADWQAQLRVYYTQRRPAEQLDPLLSTLLTFLPPVKELATASQHTEIERHRAIEEQASALLASRRGRLKNKLLEIYSGRVQDGTADGLPAFLVCVLGKERRYQRAAGFRRLEDGPTPCPVVKVTWNDIKPENAHNDPRN